VKPEVLAYAEFQSFWDCFAPETPFGREEKDRMEVIRSAEVLEALWDRTEQALVLLTELEAEPVRLDRITHHLKRLPRFPLEPRTTYSEVELFQFKKFLHNYRSLSELLGPAAASAFGFTFTSAAFAGLLDTGRQSAESFYVADAYSAGLAEVRADLRRTLAALAAERQERLQAIQERWGLQFGFRDFLLVPRTLLGDPAQATALLLVEPYDETHCVVRPLATAAELLLGDQRELLLARERCLEEDVLATLSHAARQELPALLAYLETVRSFDLAFARARLARAWGLTRPRLARGPVCIRQGRFLPCQEACQALGTRYVPLDATFNTSVTAIFGSNMGGKTVVLKTLAFLQLCVQTGLFVPAEAFTTRVFLHFHYVGEGASQDGGRGLSGFGREIRQFNAAWADVHSPTLALFDEFARTTQSQEAEALLSAAMEAMGARPELVALFSTHFRGVRRFAGVRYLRMRGLDRTGLDLCQDGASEEDRLRRINEHMDFALAPDDGARTLSDAMTVAELLGLDPGLSSQAHRYFQQED
jgi:hypothetical protein